MKTRTQNPNARTQNTERAKYTHVNKTYGAAQAERFGNYILSLDDARGGYTYSDDWGGDDLCALCDIFGV